MPARRTFLILGTVLCVAVCVRTALHAAPRPRAEPGHREPGLRGPSNTWAAKRNRSLRRIGFLILLGILCLETPFLAFAREQLRDVAEFLIAG